MDIRKASNDNLNQSKLISEAEVIPLPRKIYEAEKIREDDKAYYDKLISHLKDEYDSNDFLKGFDNINEDSYTMLAKNNYKIDDVMKQILFPTQFIRRSHCLCYIHKNQSLMNSDVYERSTLCNCPLNHYSHKVDTNINNLHSNYKNKSLQEYSNYKGMTDSAKKSCNSYSEESETGKFQNCLNSALHDLIGSNLKEKEIWFNTVNAHLEKGIGYEDLKQMLEIGEKLKIDTPTYILKEIDESLQKSKAIKQALSDKNNSLEDLEKLYSQMHSMKVQTEDLITLKDYISKSSNWKAKAKEAMETCCNFKNLQAIYNEGKNLSVKFEEFDLVKDKFLQAQGWIDKFKTIPKHSKTRQSNNYKPSEKTSLPTMKNLITESEQIFFTSHEVSLLFQAYNQLISIENRIKMYLEEIYSQITSEMSEYHNRTCLNNNSNINNTDSSITCTCYTQFYNYYNKDILESFKQELDQMKFNTSTYDDLVSLIDFISWKKEKDDIINKSNNGIKFYNLEQLAVKAASFTSNISIFQEAKDFIREKDVILNWIESVTQIFMPKDKLAAKLKNNEVIQVTIQELREIIDEANDFQIDIEDKINFFNRAEEVFEYVNECEKMINDQVYDQEKLLTLKDKIFKYNIKCEEFSKVDEYIKVLNTWVQEVDKVFEVKANRESK